MYYYIKAEKDNKPFFFCYQNCKDRKTALNELKKDMIIYYAFYNEVKADIGVFTDIEWYSLYPNLNSIQYSLIDDIIDSDDMSNVLPKGKRLLLKEDIEKELERFLL